MARDFVQDTFTKAWSNLASEKSGKGGGKSGAHGGKDIENMRAFLYRIAGNLIIDEYRRRGSRKPQESLDDLHELGFDPGEDETDSWVDQIDGEEAIKLIAQVPEPYGDEVFMRYVQSLTLEEIAEMTGESENTISVRIHRGLIKLRKLFNHECEGKKFK